MRCPHHAVETGVYQVRNAGKASTTAIYTRTQIMRLRSWFHEQAGQAPETDTCRLSDLPIWVHIHHRLHKVLQRCHFRTCEHVKSVFCGETLPTPEFVKSCPSHRYKNRGGYLITMRKTLCSGFPIASILSRSGFPTTKANVFRQPTCAQYSDCAVAEAQFGHPKRQ